MFPQIKPMFLLGITLFISCAIISIFWYGVHVGTKLTEEKQLKQQVIINQKLQQANKIAIDYNKIKTVDANYNKNVEGVLSNANTSDDVTIDAKWVCYYTDSCTTSSTK